MLRVKAHLCYICKYSLAHRPTLGQLNIPNYVKLSIHRHALLLFTKIKIHTTKEEEKNPEYTIIFGQCKVRLGRVYIASLNDIRSVQIQIRLRLVVVGGEGDGRWSGQREYLHSVSRGGGVRTHQAPKCTAANENKFAPKALKVHKYCCNCMHVWVNDSHTRRNYALLNTSFRML